VTDVRRQRRLGAGIVAVIATLVLSACGGSDAADDGGFVAGDGSIVTLGVAERQPAPDLQGTTLDGDTLRLADYLGEVVVLNVWASWCAPCRAEAATLAATADELASRGVQFIGLDTRDSDVSARAFADRFGIEYPNVVDRDGTLQLLFGDSLPPQAIPSTVVIDQQGRVAARILGRASESSLKGVIEPLLAEQGS
jgi:peroxiredoxin